MQDSFNRKISYLRLSVTDNCNYRCPYCMPDKDVNHKRNLSFDQLYNVCLACVSCGITKVRITGGEPLLRDGIVDFCNRLSKIKEIEELAITTNGYYLEDLSKQLYDAGVDRLNISLDTLNRDKYASITKNGNFDKVIRGIKSALSCNFKKIKLNIVLIKGFNDNEIKDYVELTKDNDISIRFIELMPTSGSSLCQDNYMPCDTVLKVVPELEMVSFDNVSEVYRIDGYKGTVGLIRPISSAFCDKCNRIRVTSDGKIKTCLHSSEEYDLSVNDVDKMICEIKSAIILKPDKHNLNKCFQSLAQRSMYQIGG